MIVIYTRKTPVCPWCIRAKTLLNQQNLDYKELVVGENISRDDFVRVFWSNVENPRPTVPQIVINDGHIGGYEELKSWLDQHGNGE